MSSDERPLGELLPDLAMAPLPEGWTPIAAVVFVKFAADDGSYEWSMVQAGETWLLQESLGVIEGVAASIEAELAQHWFE